VCGKCCQVQYLPATDGEKFLSFPLVKGHHCGAWVQRGAQNIINKKFGSPTNQVRPRRSESISRFFAEKMSESIFVQGIGGQM
jgi:hypothetical protein